MASNFKISVHQDSDKVHLKLMGDFDGTSAYELLNVLKENRDGAVKVFVDTTGLKNIYPFGRDTFHSKLYVLKDRPIRLLFTGKNATEIAPERNKFFFVP